MPQPCCDHRIFCPEGAGNLDFDSPLKNISAEAADPITFLGINWGWDRKAPPVNRWWITNSCLGVCESGISQADADACAARNELECIVPGWNDPAPQNPPPGPPEVPPRIPVPIYTNNPESCSSQCPDGLTFTYTTPAGKYAALSQIQADRMAASEACRFAISARMCLSDLNPRSCCTGHQYLAVLHCAGGVLPLGFSVVSGSLPPGIVLSQGPGDRDVSLAGSPSAGSFTFTIRVDDSIGNFMQKTYTLEVGGIDQATLTDATVNAPYSETLTASNLVAPLLWELVSGTLPAGLDLNSASGEIFGAATLSGDFTFTIGVTDFVGTRCTRDLSIRVVGLTCPVLEGNFAELGIVGLNAAKDAAIGRLILWGVNRLVDAVTHATIAPLAVDPNPGACYVPTIQKFCSSVASTGFHFIDATNGNVNTVGTQADCFTTPDYSSDEDTIYSLGFDGITFHWNICRVAAATEVILTHADIGILPGTPGNVAYCGSPKRLLTNGVTGAQTIDLLSLPAGGVLASRNLSPTGFGGFGNSMIFHPGTGHFFVSCWTDDPAMTLQVLELDPTALALIHTYTLEPSGAGNTFILDYNPTNGEIYVGGATQLWAIDPGTKTVLCGVVTAGYSPFSIGFDQFSQRVFTSDSIAGKVEHYQ